MKRRFILLLLLLIGSISLLSFFSVLHFIDPYENQFFSLFLLISSYLWMVLWIGTIFLYFFKKIYYRGDVEVIHVLTSMRQSLLMWICGMSYVALVYFSIPIFIPFLWVVLFLLSFELFLLSLHYTY